MVVGNLCSITICIAVLFNLIHLSITLCKRGKAELRAIGWIKGCAMVLCSSPAILQEVLQARVRTGPAWNRADTGHQAASDGESEELLPIIRSEPLTNWSHQREVERSDSLRENLMTGTWSNDSEPLTTFLTENGDVTETIPRRNSGRCPTYTPHHATHPGHVGPMTHEMLARVPRTVDSTVRALTHVPIESAARAANRKFQATLKEND